MFCWNMFFFATLTSSFGFASCDFAARGVIVGWNRLFVLLQLIIGGFVTEIVCWIMAVLVDDGGEPEPVTREIFATTT